MVVHDNLLWSSVVGLLVEQFASTGEPIVAICAGYNLSFFVALASIVLVHAN
jgi:hypothetical protein